MFQLEGEVDASTTIILDLQKERTLVCEMMAARSAASTPTGEPELVGGEKRRRLPEGAAPAFLPDLAHVPQDQFQRLQQLVQEEQQRRGVFGAFGNLEGPAQSAHLQAKAGMDIDSELEELH